MLGIHRHEPLRSSTFARVRAFVAKLAESLEGTDHDSRELSSKIQRIESLCDFR